MKASHRRVIKALEDGAQIRDCGSPAKMLPVRLSGKTLFMVSRKTLQEMVEAPDGLVVEWRL